LDFEKFDHDRMEVLDRSWKAGVNRILIPAINYASSLQVLRLANEHQQLFCAIGIHPTDSTSWSHATNLGLKELYDGIANVASKNIDSSTSRSKIVAIGEVGLDYYWEDATREHQKMVLGEMLTLSAELQLPVILHMREKNDAPDGDCASDMIQILDDWTRKLRMNNNRLADAPGVLHSFSGNKLTADKAIDLNFYIGITGPVTYKNAAAKREVVKSLPLESLLIETDGPFLAPVPERGHRNEPAFVRHIADKIAEIHNINPEKVATITSNNSARLFSWGG